MTACAEQKISLGLRLYAQVDFGRSFYEALVICAWRLWKDQQVQCYEIKWEKVKMHIMRKDCDT